MLVQCKGMPAEIVEQSANGIAMHAGGTFGGPNALPLHQFFANCHNLAFA